MVSRPPRLASRWPLAQPSIAMRYAFFFLLVSTVSLAGCTSSGETTQTTSHLQIGLEEIKESSARTAFDLIRQHRPNWFRESERDYSSYARGTRRVGFIVYLDGQRYGEGASALSSITAARIHEINYLDASKALSRHGLGHEEGAIHIVTRYEATQDEERKKN